MANLLPDVYNYKIIKKDTDEYVFRIEKISEKEQVYVWLDKFNFLNKTTWRVARTYPNSGRLNLFKIDMRCAFSENKRLKGVRPSKQACCRATLQMLIKRKQELRELKMLQKQETKQFQDLALKAQFSREQQEKKFEQEMMMNYDNDLEALNRQQKQLVEKAEQQQELDLKFASKKIRADQDRDIKAFRESLKNEFKFLKQEVDALPKDKRKDILKVRKEQMEIDHAERG